MNLYTDSSSFEASSTPSKQSIDLSYWEMLWDEQPKEATPAGSGNQSSCTAA